MKTFVLILFSFFSLSLALEQDSLALFTVDSVYYEIGDAFDDAKVYSALDSGLYAIGNALHIETRESVIKKFIFFEKGDTVNLYQLIEAERLLREQPYLSDALIEKKVIDGKNILRVKTSDNWTISIPVGLQKVGDAYYYNLGVQENNLLGFGKKFGVYYGHDEYRDRFSLAYNDAHFLKRYNHLELFYSNNTDGYTSFAQMNLPYLRRSVNQWSYTFQAFTNKSDVSYVWSGKLPPGAVPYSHEDSSPDKQWVNQVINGENKTVILKIKALKEDSISFRLARSFGSAEKKFYLGATYDYHRLGYDFNGFTRYTFSENKANYVLDPLAVNDWIPKIGDSRLGFYLIFSRLRYDRIKNFKNVKWNEDVDKGYTVRFGAAKNVGFLGAKNDDWRLDNSIYLALGEKAHHLILKANSYFYLNSLARHHIYESVSGEYIWHPNDMFSTSLFGLMDTYKASPYGFQLTLGGIEGLYGLPSQIYGGQARFYSHLEQRFFSNFEIGTIMPVFAAFVSAGQTVLEIKDFEPKEVTIMAGFGVHLALTKSVAGLINHLNFSWPIKGPKRSMYPTFTLTSSYSL